MHYIAWDGLQQVGQGLVDTMVMIMYAPKGALVEILTLFDQSN